MLLQNASTMIRKIRKIQTSAATRGGLLQPEMETTNAAKKTVMRMKKVAPSLRLCKNTVPTLFPRRLLVLVLVMVLVLVLVMVMVMVLLNTNQDN